MDKRKIALLVVAFSFMLLLANMAWAVDGYDLSWSIIGGGGGHLEAAPYILDGTIGQPIVGQAASLPYELCAGFWCQVAAQYRVYLPLVLRNS